MPTVEVQNKAIAKMHSAWTDFLAAANEARHQFPAWQELGDGVEGVSPEREAIEVHMGDIKRSGREMFRKLHDGSG